MLDLQSLKKLFNDGGVIFTYNGVISHDILTNIVQALENKFEGLKFYERSAQDVFTVLIEMIQNIINYCAEKEEPGQGEGACEGIIILGIDPANDKLYLKSGNMIEADKKDRIAKRIESIKNLSKEDLRAKYRELRKTRKQKSARGAGLGFLEIQRRASEPINYSFSDINNGGLLFVLDVYL